MQVRFWGVRGSCPAPLSGEDVASRLAAALRLLGAEANPPDLHDEAAVARWIETLPIPVRGTTGGNTPCVEMRTDDGHLFIIDFGSGLRALGDSLMGGAFGRGQGRAHLFLSHFHWDHIQGWPFFKPCYVSGNRLSLWTRHEKLEERLQQQQSAPFFPSASWADMAADIFFCEFGDEALHLDGVRVSTLELNHPSRAYAYRFETDGKVFVYASDSSYPLHPGPDAEEWAPFIEFYRDADLLIFDAQFSPVETQEKGSWGHSSAHIGVEIARLANVKTLALFHHDPGTSDEAVEQVVASATRQAPASCRIIAAREGMTISL